MVNGKPLYQDEEKKPTDLEGMVQVGSRIIARRLDEKTRAFPPIETKDDLVVTNPIKEIGK